MAHCSYPVLFTVDKEDDGYILARFIDFVFYASGESIEEVKERLRHFLSETLSYNLEHHTEMPKSLGYKYLKINPNQFIDIIEV